ncbi:unnamed protein product [Rhizophagus irregularis]|nr:unnamed protein product [Rhizophagus irregularis]
MMITLSLTFVSSRTDQTGSFRTAIWTSKNAKVQKPEGIVSFGTNIRDTGRNDLFFRNGSFSGFLRMQDRREEQSLLSEWQNGLFFRNGSFSGFLRMQDRREETIDGRNVSSFETEPLPRLEFVKGNWHSGFFFNNCSAFLY